MGGTAVWNDMVSHTTAEVTGPKKFPNEIDWS